MRDKLSRWFSARSWRDGLLVAVVAHWLIMGLFAFEVIPQQTNRDSQFFYFHHGGDNHPYYWQARNLSLGTVGEFKYPLGFSMLLVPVFYLADSPAHDEALPAVAFFWSMVMFPLGVALLGWIAQQLTRHRLATVMSLWLYVALPLLVLGVLSVAWSPVMAEISAIHLPWAQMLSDGPTAFFTLLSAALFIRARQRDYAWGWLSVLGIVLGCLVLIRLSGALIAFVIALICLLERRVLKLAWVTALALLAFSPQLLYNWHFFGNPLATGYAVLEELPAYGLFHPHYLADALGTALARLGAWVVVGGVAALLGLGLGLRGLWRRDPMSAVLVGGWALSYVAFYSLYYHTWTGAFLRFMIPALPALCILGALVLVQAWAWCQRRK